MIKTFFNTLIKFILIFIVFLVIGLVSLYGAYSISMTSLYENTKRSLSSMEKVPINTKYIVPRELRHYVIGNFDNRNDFYTDTLIIANSGLNVKRKPIIKIIGEKNPENNNKRYWHGYVSVFRPLLTFLTCNEIRIFNFILSTLLFGLLLLNLYKKGKGEYIIPFTASILLMNIITFPFFLSFSPAYLISVIAMLIILNFSKQLQQKNNYIYLFFIIGICLAFFELLIIPLITLCLPLLIFLTTTENNLKENLKIIFFSSFSWLIGYVSFWLAGILVNSAICEDTGIIENAFKEFLMRTSHINTIDYRDEIPADEITLNDLFGNILPSFPDYSLIAVITLFIINSSVILFNIKYLTKEMLLKILPFVIVSIYPFIWYLCTPNQSFQHDFTAKIYIIFAFGILTAVTCLRLMIIKNKKQN